MNAEEPSLRTAPPHLQTAPTPDEIARAVHAVWEQAGSPASQDVPQWILAETQLWHHRS